MILAACSLSLQLLSDAEWVAGSKCMSHSANGKEWISTLASCSISLAAN